MTEQQVLKRSAGKCDNENGGRKKMPYAPRACDACRKRKGKCCGRCPCEYCIGRNQHCKYSPTTAEWRIAKPKSVTGPDQTDLPQIQASQSLTSAVNYSSQLHAGTRFYCASSNSAASDQSLVALRELVADLHGQVNVLAAQLRQVNEDKATARSLASSSATNQTVSKPEIETRQSVGGLRPSKISPVDSHNDPAPPANDCTISHAQTQFCGPTSPDYGLNVAQINLGRKHLPITWNGRSEIASVFENQPDDGDLAIAYEEEISARSQQQATGSSVQQRLLMFRSTLDVHEATRLLNVYQEVVGEYHPIVNTKTMITHLTAWYERQDVLSHLPAPSIDQNNLLVINLTIAIALCAESTIPGSKSFETGMALYLSCKEIIDAKLVSPMPSINHVVIIILVGFLHFYKDMLRYAWRMCGLAGRTLMELGLHNGEVSRSVITSDSESLDYINIVSSIIVLDRQWSAATGLPSHFKNFDFDMDLRQSLKNPYLKAMVLFTSMSDKFNEPILRVTKGETFEDDDEFEIMNFQIEQWRKKSVGHYGQKHALMTETATDGIPPWALLLKLRANAVLSLLLRPFFLAYKPGAAGCRSIQRGLDLVTDTINTLTSLDKNTDIYRKQHPPFQHVLATACALLFLIIAYVDQGRGNISADLPKDYSELVARNFKQAYHLASTYSKSSRASRRLWKRLVQMKKLLADSGVGGRDVMMSNDQPFVIPDVSRSTITQPTVINNRSDDPAQSLCELDHSPDRRIWDMYSTPGLSNNVCDSTTFPDLDYDIPFASILTCSPGIRPSVGVEARRMDHFGLSEDEWPMSGSDGFFYSA